MIRIAICEDDSFYIEKEKDMIEAYLKEKDEKYELSVFYSGTEFINNYKSAYDIIFLDIAMDGIDGLEIARWLRAEQSKAFIVFLTAYAKYSIEGYKVDAHRFLLKDDAGIKQAISECMESALDKLKKGENKVELKVQGGPISVSPSKILFVESRAHRVIFHMVEGTGKISEHYMYDRLDNIQEMLNGYGFRRIHQSYLVNTAYLKTVSRYNAELTNGVILAISKKYYDEIENYFVRMREDF